MENELFSMLLTSMEQNSFQNVVPDIANNSNPLLNTTTPDIVCTKPMMSIPKSHAHYNHQLEDYPLDMQFPKPGKEKQGSAVSNNKKRKLKCLQDDLKEEKAVKDQKKVKLEGEVSNFSEDEKRQKRLEKNREAAHMFRQRQKVYINDLEKKVNDYTLENQHFKSKIELLTTENRLLNDQLSYLRNFMANVMSRSDQGPMLTSMFHSFQSGGGASAGNIPSSSSSGPASHNSHSRMLNNAQHQQSQQQQQQQHHPHSNYQSNGVSSFSYANPSNSYKLYSKDSN